MRAYLGVFLLVAACHGGGAGGAVKSGSSDELHPTPPPFPALTLDDAEAKIGKPGVYFYDANPREMYDRGHVPGATWVVWDDLSTVKLPDDKAAMLVFYCANEWCTASHESARRAQKLGYTNVALMPRGILGWKKAKKPLEPGPEAGVGSGTR